MKIQYLLVSMGVFYAEAIILSLTLTHFKNFTYMSARQMDFAVLS